MTENNTSLKIISLQKMFSNQILQRYAQENITKGNVKKVRSTILF